MSVHAILRGVWVTHLENVLSDHAVQREGVHVFLSGARARAFSAALAPGVALHVAHSPRFDYAALDPEWKMPDGGLPLRIAGVSANGPPAPDADDETFAGRDVVELLLPGRVDRFVGEAVTKTGQPYAALLCDPAFLANLKSGDLVYRDDSGPPWGTVPPQYKRADGSPRYDPADGRLPTFTDLRPPPPTVDPVPDP